MRPLIPAVALLLSFTSIALAQTAKKLGDSATPSSVEGGVTAVAGVGSGGAKAAYRVGAATARFRTLSEALIARAVKPHDLAATLKKELSGNEEAALCLAEPLQDWIAEQAEGHGDLELAQALILYSVAAKRKKLAGIDAAWRAACPLVYPAKAAYKGRDSAQAVLIEAAKALTAPSAAAAANAAKGLGKAVDSAQSASAAETAARAIGLYEDSADHGLAEALESLAAATAAEAGARAAALDSLARVARARPARAAAVMKAAEALVDPAAGQPEKVHAAAARTLGAAAAVRWNGVWSEEARAARARLVALHKAAEPAKSATHALAESFGKAVALFPKPPTE